MATADLTPHRLRELLEYNQETGIFTWKTATGKTKMGSRAGSTASHGYRVIRLDYQIHYEHRLAFLYMEGCHPKESIDHINGSKSDNRWNNLRHASETTNNQNIRTPSRNNASGWLGVYAQKGTGKFISQVSAGQRCFYLGTFDTGEEAHRAYVEAKRKLHEGCTL